MATFLVMASFEMAPRDEKIQDLLHGDRGMAALLEPILNQVLQAEMSEHLHPEPGKRAAQRRSDSIHMRA
jgi:transposase-like protein